MSTRNLTMVVDRDYASNPKIGFAQDPWNLGDNSYVNMYLHHDGYPQWQGVQLANWVKANARQDGSALAAKLVHDMYYDSCYLYPDPQNIDHQYTYVIWTGDKARTMIACHDRYSEQCVFVSTPDKIIETYKDDMQYTDFANGKTRFGDVGVDTITKDEIAKYNKIRANAQSIVDILTTD